MTAVVQRTVSRNDPCPCGSGRRFKDCHGSLRGDAAPVQPIAPVPVRKSRYRPGGDDWAALGDEECDQLGALMELALKHQLEQRVREAERAYRAVLEQAPRTHDALHMLGVIRLGLGDFVDAERLIRDAKALRPSYPAIETNWALVQRSIAARDRRGIELLSEHALPLLCAALAAARPAPKRDSAMQSASLPLHVVGCAADAGSDAAWTARRVLELLASFRPTAWRGSDIPGLPAMHGPDCNGPAVSHEVRSDESTRWQRLDLHAIDPGTGRQPLAGDVILASLECETDSWLRAAIGRVLVLPHAALPSLYLERLRRIAADGGRAVALVFESHAKARRFGSSDYVVPPPIDLDEYRDVRSIARGSSSSIRIAAAGQDGRRVVVASDVDLLKTVAARTGELWLHDPGPLRYDVGLLSAVKCIARGERTIEEVLARADLYLHRALPWWAEGSGRALFGAMALGVPVLCHRDSIYAEYIDDGVDGFFYTDETSAASVIDALRSDRSRLTAAARAARAKALRLFEPRALREAYADVVRRWRAAA